ncbi:MAG: hypothetical protein KJ727_05765 [Acidobacteria bacterium]|nr:hypothetical protein [Acidobacteriota bacterium]
MSKWTSAIVLAALFMSHGTAAGADLTGTTMDMLKENAPKVFLDCWRCDMDYIRTNMTFINYVRDRQIADIHILVTIQQTGPGGHEYTLDFIGRGNFADIHHNLTYVSNRTDSWDDTRKGMVEVLKNGLLPFMLRTPLADLFKVEYVEKPMPSAVKDKWNYWVYSASFGGSLWGQQTQGGISLKGNLSANQVTPDMKLRFGVSGNYNENRYDLEDGDRILSMSESTGFSGLAVKSITDHWSAGCSLGISSSTYNNIDFGFNPALALEYNVFPYSQSTRRQLRLLYRLGYGYNTYHEKTIYEKTREQVIGQSLDVVFALREPWGNAEINLSGSHLFHDLSLNQISIEGDLNLRLLRGLSLSLNAGYSQIHNQISLPKGGATLEEILLNRKILATNYSYSMSIGFSYTFGSIYSNVVNPRFGF